MKLIQKKHILVSGKVQGVYFRAFTAQKAKEFKLKGWVRNLINGSVEIFIEGENTKIKEFILKIKKGPEEAYVTEMKIKDIKDEALSMENLNSNKDENFLILKDSSKALID